jgi:hypothetical protein
LLGAASRIIRAAASEPDSDSILDFGGSAGAELVDGCQAWWLAAASGVARDHDRVQVLTPRLDFHGFVGSRPAFCSMLG